MLLQLPLAPQGLAAGARALLGACAARLAHTAAGRAAREDGAQKEAKRAAHHGVPTTLAEVPPQRNAPRPNLCLSSINDPTNWGLAAGGAQGSSEEHFWVQSASSLRDPKDHLARSASSHGPRPAQGFRCPAGGASTVQRKVLFRTSMMDPEQLPFDFRSSMMDPPLRVPRRG